MIKEEIYLHIIHPFRNQTQGADWAAIDLRNFTVLSFDSHSMIRFVNKTV